ncbi:MAG: heat-inducible transcriptional repressor HrcA [Gemmatimonadota bacterium]
MASLDQLTEREFRVLEAVIQTYIETAEPAGSQTIARRFGLGVSSATIRNTMGDLEERGYLFHPHTSAGRIPTDRAYRWYVDNLMRSAPPNRADQQTLLTELPTSRSAVEEIIRRAAQVLGVLTQELGVAVGPALEETVLERLELVPVSSDRLLLVFNLRSGAIRTIFVEAPVAVPAEVLARVSQTINERLAGHSLREIRATLSDRLRDAADSHEGRQLLNIFIAEGDDILSRAAGGEEVLLGSTTVLAEQPEFASNDRMRHLLALTDRRDLLREALAARRAEGVNITIGGENLDPRLTGFTLVTSSYRAGDLRGVIGVLGPTRMPYEKIIGLVEHTSRLVEGLME